MRFTDHFVLAVRGLWRQKLRSALTVVGVAVGACALAFTISLGIGLRHMVDSQLKLRAEYWQVEVRAPEYDLVPEKDIPPEMIAVPAGINGPRRDRVREMLVREYQQLHPRRPANLLTDARLAELSAIPDVADVVAGIQIYSTLRWRDQSQDQMVVAFPVRRMNLASRLVAGELPADDNDEGIIVSEHFLFNLGVRTDAELAAAIGQPVGISVGRRLGPFMPRASGTYRLAAVFRAMTNEEQATLGRSWYPLNQADVFLPVGAGKRLWERAPGNQGAGYAGCTVYLQPGGDLRAVVARIEGAGFRTHSMLPQYDSEKMEVTLIAAGLNLFAMISVAVAALGIANTLATSVVERTREIGVLKAVGATRTQVLALFLAEGTVIGLLGGALGLAAAWGLTFPADRFVAHLINEQSHGHFTVSTVFEFPFWLPLTTIFFATGVTTLAALLPARRAARLEPIIALRSM
ncbi:ABC transporter permease [Zavarzinella formosa]|uniref:ABC transporter permease n=1 Tax=Zavarzinella formosa TaxID=360055 RepID=UPI0002E74EC0|nr:ABC transporter permease [Zavarzinella formosa]